MDSSAHSSARSASGRATSQEIFISIPRRKSYRAEGLIANSPVTAASSASPKLKLWEIATRYWVYGTFFMRLMAGNTWDSLRGRGSTAHKASRLRAMIQRLGPTSIKIGQQLGTRTDILRPEYCEELNRLLDQVQPIPREQTIAILEDQFKQPLNKIFTAFDLEPIGSGSIASVYQAHLLDGTKVAVKVRRPRVDRLLLADFHVLRAITRWCERFSLIRTGRSRPVLDELEQMLTDEMDFILESRQTALFRREAKETEYVSAPKVFTALCTKQVMVTAFADGISMNEIINAVQKEDHALIAELEAMGYDFRQISRHLLRAYFWQTFESTIFHADLHPANILVTPDNKFVLVDFGCCGTLSQRHRHALVGFLRSLGGGDIASAARFMIMLNEPLPPLDLEQYKFEMERVIRKFLIMNRSKDVPWHEKCWGGAMKDFVELSRKFNIPVKAELLRYSRANSHLDFMVYRLHPKADPRREFYHWYAQRAKRARKKFRRDLSNQVGVLADAASIGLGDLGQASFQLFSRVREFLDGGGFGFASVVNKLPFAISVFIRFLMNVVFLLVVAIGVRLFIRTRTGVEIVNYADEILAVATHPAFHLVVLGLLLIGLRKILVRTTEVDVD